ncbi:MAG: thioredoxin family protein [Nitrososphaerales archaeon]
MVKLKVSSWKGKEEFAEISNSSEPKLILFAAKWCGYCSLFLKMAKEFKPSSDAELVLIDADDADESLWDDYKLNLVPTLVVFQSGKELFRKDGMSGIGLRASDLSDALNFLSAKSRSI